MSLIRAPRHTVTVVLRQEQDDGEGALEYIETGRVEVPCNVHPSTTTDVESFGVKPNDLYTVTAPPGTWPGDPLSLIIWEGETYTQRGRVLKSRMGRATQHDKVYMERGNGTGL
ncbi:hypothetical protein [Rothia nasimurium]|uniref:hypothetical protein n=1 Tax=Rothia nasimurium TaxID=85336 RepID=UPI001F40C522|nr:hypothetical protein [Rothia nasimurium]